MEKDVMNQGQLHKLQVEKAKFQIQKMRLGKEKAEQELLKLKRQLVEKDEEREDSYKLRRALEKTERYQQQLPEPKPLKPKQEQIFVKKTYSYELKESKSQPQPPIAPTQNQHYLISNNFQPQFQQGLQSLYGQTVKIPIISNEEKLTMSNIDELDVKKMKYLPQKQQKQSHFRSEIKDQIDDPVRREFIKHLSGEDELDRFVKEPPGKWGQMSSIDSQGTKQIQQLLKQQQYQYNNQNFNRPESRPKSKLSNVGNQILNGNLGYAADGFTLQSNNNEGTYNTNFNDGTFNLLKINDVNDKRLSKLRQMGIQTIGQDEEVEKLDRLLARY